MIHVQIASQITAQGVSGVRWVLLETVDAMQADQAAPAVALAAADTPAAAVAAGAAPTAEGLRLGVLKAGVVALGLGAALWTAMVQVGPPGQAAAPGATATNAPAAVSPPVQHQRQAVPLRIAPAAQPGTRSTAPSTPAAPAASRPVAAPAKPAAPAASDGLPRLTAAL